jgi:hypothetical protein
MMGGGSVDCEGFGGGWTTHLTDDELCRIGLFFPLLFLAAES